MKLQVFSGNKFPGMLKVEHHMRNCKAPIEVGQQAIQPGPQHLQSPMSSITSNLIRNFVVPNHFSVSGLLMPHTSNLDV